MQIIVHAGMHKTGTTAFQMMLNDKRLDLLADGVRILTPKSGVKITSTGFPERQLSEAISLAAAEGTRLVIISHETISLFDAKTLSHFRSVIGAFPARYVVVLRHWCSYLPSRWTQNCRRRDGVSFPRFLDGIGTEEPWISFDKVLLNARNAGFDDVRAISYEPFGGSLTEELTKACDLDVSAEKQSFHQSLPLRTVEKLRLFNAARASDEGLAINGILDSIEKAQPVGVFFDQLDTVTKALKMLPHLDETLDRLIDETQVEVAIDPQQFTPLADKVETVLGKSIFSKITPHQKSYSSMEFDELPSKVRAQMTLGLRHAKLNFLSRAKEKFWRKFMPEFTR